MIEDLEIQDYYFSHYRKLKFIVKIQKELLIKFMKKNALDVLDDIESIDDEEQYVQAIGRTKLRTRIIIGHINKCMKYYESICKGDGKDRRFNIIQYMYIEPSKEEVVPSYEKVAEHFDITTKTVGRDVRATIEDLSILFLELME